MRKSVQKMVVAIGLGLAAFQIQAAPQAAGVGAISPLANADSSSNPVSRLQQGVVEQVGNLSSSVVSLVDSAFSFIGTPYKLGGNSIETGFDCSGFIKTLFAGTLGVKLPRTAAEQAAATEKIQKSELKPGDLVFFNTRGKRPNSHVGVYVGEGKFIHAPRTGKTVSVESMESSNWSKRFNGARRVEGATDTGS